MSKFDDGPSVKDKFYDDDLPVSILVDQEVDLQVSKSVSLPTFQKTNQLVRKVFSVKVMCWVDKFVDDLVYQLDKEGIRYTKGEVTEKAFKLLYERMKKEGVNVKIRKEFRKEFDDV